MRRSGRAPTSPSCSASSTTASQNNKVQWEYVKAFTNAPYIVKEGYGFQDGLFTGYDEAKRDYDRSTWDYEIGDDGFVKVDDDAAASALRLEPAEGARAELHAGDGRAHLRHAARTNSCKVCEMIAETSAPDKAMTSMYALGWTQHSKGSQNIRAHGDAAADARQYRHARRRHERAARSLQHPGADRHRPDVEPDARLSDAADRQGADFADLHVEARLQAGAARTR